MDNTRFGPNLQQMGGMLHMNNMNNGMNMNQFGNIGGIQNHLIGNIGNNQPTG